MWSGSPKTFYGHVANGLTCVISFTAIVGQFILLMRFLYSLYVAKHITLKQVRHRVKFHLCCEVLLGSGRFRLGEAVLLGGRDTLSYLCHWVCAASHAAPYQVVEWSIKNLPGALVLIASDGVWGLYRACHFQYVVPFKNIRILALGKCSRYVWIVFIT